MANETLITDLVAQEALDQLAALDKAMEDTLSQYTTVAKEMAKGLRIPVEVQGDLDKITQVYNTQMKNAAQTTQQLTQIQQQQQQVIANTTNTISRQLAEQEKLNKAQREAYTEQQRGLDIAKNVLGTHEQNVALMARYNKELKNLKDAYKNSAVSAEEYTRRELELKTAKAELQKILNNETKMMQSAEGSYQRMSLQLERMKMAQKQLNEEQKNGTAGQVLEKEIQSLDAHLKDMAADMGEFQRNVGNYAIAANAGVKDTEGSGLDTSYKEAGLQWNLFFTCI
jgi:chromosome segregation ATPase